MNQSLRACARNLIQFTPNNWDIAAAFLARDESQLKFGLPVGQAEIQQGQSRLLRRDEYLNRAARAQAGVLLTNHIAPGKRTLVQKRAAQGTTPVPASTVPAPVQLEMAPRAPASEDPFGLHLEGSNAQSIAARGVEGGGGALQQGNFRW